MHREFALEPLAVSVRKNKPFKYLGDGRIVENNGEGCTSRRNAGKSCARSHHDDDDRTRGDERVDTAGAQPVKDVLC